MGSSDETAKKPPDSNQNDDVYAKNEEGEPRMVSTSRTEERLAEGGSSQIVDLKVYGSLLLLGVVLVALQQSTISTIGFVLIAIGVFIGIVDVLSRG